MVKTIKNKILYEKNINEIPAKASAIVFPDNIQELKNLVKTSKEDIIARGSGTSFTGAVIPKNSVVVDFSKMNQILEINPEKKFAIVEPGVLLRDLNDELQQYNLEFPIEPLFAGIETIGGMIAKNSSGNREIKYGRVISWIDSLEVINGRGEQIHISKSDLSDFVGMEGTTGLIIRAVLRLTSKKNRSITILKINNLQDVFIANKKLRLKQDISAIDLLSPEISSLLGLEKKYHIFAEHDNPDGTFKEESYTKFIRLRNKFYKKAAMEGWHYMANAKFLIDSLQDFLIFLEEKNIPFLSNMASGTVFPLFKQIEMEKLQDALRFAKKLRAKIAYNFGIGLTKKDSLENGEIELIRRAKNRQDPEWKFNRDKLIDYKLIEKNDKAPEVKEKKSDKILDSKKELSEPSQNIKSEASINSPDTQKNTDSAEELIQKSQIETLKRPETELSQEEKDKIKKIAAGFFAGGRKN
jgi:hypothetical protein